MHKTNKSRQVKMKAHPNRLNEEESLLWDKAYKRFCETGVWKMEDEYVPTSLRLPEEYESTPIDVMYAIGQDDGEGGYGMWDGPNPSQREMLEIEGRDEYSVIIRFNTDGTDEVIWRWDNNRWRRERNDS